jgi:pfkB family carbohydrate kinase
VYAARLANGRASCSFSTRLRPRRFRKNSSRSPTSSPRTARRHTSCRGLMSAIDHRRSPPRARFDGAGRVTVGTADGRAVVGEAGEHWLPSHRVAVIDTTGAGDPCAAAIAVALAEGRSFVEACCGGVPRSQCRLKSATSHRRVPQLLFRIELLRAHRYESTLSADIRTVLPRNNSATDRVCSFAGNERAGRCNRAVSRSQGTLNSVESYRSTDEQPTWCPLFP